MVNFTTVACRISSWLKLYKNYKNRLRLAKVIVENKMSRFYGSLCIYGKWKDAAPKQWKRTWCCTQRTKVAAVVIVWPHGGDRVALWPTFARRLSGRRLAVRRISQPPLSSLAQPCIVGHATAWFHPCPFSNCSIMAVAPAYCGGKLASRVCGRWRQQRSTTTWCTLLGLDSGVTNNRR